MKVYIGLILKCSSDKSSTDVCGIKPEVRDPVTMKTYLEGCGVPTAWIGQAEVPRLIMGINP